MKLLFRATCAAAVIGVGLSACGSTSSDSGGSTTEPVTFSVWQTGLTGVLPLALADDKEIQKKYGIEVKALTTPNLPEVYQNLLTGRANANIGAPETVASIQAQGGNVRIGGVVAPNTMAIIGRTAVTPEQMKGKRLAAITSSGAWTLMKARLKSEFGIDADKDLQVVSVPNTLTGAAQVVAGTADFVMGWEPAVTQTVTKYPDLKVVVTTKQLKTDTSWQFVLWVSDKVSNEEAPKLLEAIDAVTDKLRADPALADKYGKLQGYTDDTVSRVLANKSLPIDAKPLDDSLRASIMADLKTVYEGGGLKNAPTESVFTGIAK